MNDGCSGTPCTSYSAHGQAIISACRKYNILRSVNNIWTLTNKIKCIHSKIVIAKLLFKFWLAYENFVDMAIDFDKQYETIKLCTFPCYSNSRFLFVAICFSLMQKEREKLDEMKKILQPRTKTFLKSKEFVKNSPFS